MGNLQSITSLRPRLFVAPIQQQPMASSAYIPSSMIWGNDTQRRLLQLTTKDLQDGLQNGSWTSEDLINVSLKQIEVFDHQGPHINAMISMTSRVKLLAQARSLDLERQEGKLRGPMHGIPIVLKVI
jgi:amidase